MAREKVALKTIMALLKEKKPLLENNFKIKEIGIFGSYVRGEHTYKSDVDILVNYKDESIDLFDFLELQEYLSLLIGARVDLVMKKSLKPQIGKNILSQVLYA